MEGNLAPDGVAGFDYDTQGAKYQCGNLTWPMQIPYTGDQNTLHVAAQSNTLSNNVQPSTPQYHHNDQEIGQSLPQTQTQPYISDWPLQQPQNAFGYQLDGSFPSNASYNQQFLDEPNYSMLYQASSTEYTPSHGQFDSNLGMNGSCLQLQNQLGGTGLPFDWQNIPLAYSGTNDLSDMSFTTPNLSNSPTDTSLEIGSLPSSDNGWTMVDFPSQRLDNTYQNSQVGAIFNPEQTLHNRTFSDSSNSDGSDSKSGTSSGSWVEIPQHAVGSPESEGFGSGDQLCHDSSEHGGNSPQIKQEPCHHSPPWSTLASPGVEPINIKTSLSPQRSPTSPQKRISPFKKQPKKKELIDKSPKSAIRQPFPAPKMENGKRVGRRKGPLKAEQRKQAGEIRKLGACLRCKYLKKPCDPGEECFGCKPSHARLWQVPCCRMDVKELWYFMKDWKADCERNVSLLFSVGNIKGFGDAERTLFITHGYGQMLPVQARQIFVRDESCFGLDWVETNEDVTAGHSVNTAKLSTGREGISTQDLDRYLDKHIHSDFESFIKEYFDGTPFISDMLKIAFRFWQTEQTPVLKKSLKMLLAYNLTQHITMVEGIPDEEGFLGRIDDEDSKFYGRTVAPVMINFEIKCAMAELWRDLQKDVLEDLSALFQRFYSKDKINTWPVIFIVCVILLAVWEEMQFDCHYRVQDEQQVDKFCNDMESLPVKVITGLFSAISTKVPAFQEWDTQKHHQCLGSNRAVCTALEETRDTLTNNDQYLRDRCETAAFDPNDFDSLSNKFTSKLVIRAAA